MKLIDFRPITLVEIFAKTYQLEQPTNDFAPLEQVVKDWCTTRCEHGLHGEACARRTECREFIENH